MVRRSSLPPPKPPDWPPEKTYAALKSQLAALDNFRGRHYQEAENDETAWVNLTLNMLTHGFGSDSNNVTQFRRAGDAGEYYIVPGGMSQSHCQGNFVKRIEAYGAALEGTVAELEWMMPEPEIAGTYEPGDDYRFYKDLKTIVGFASKELFIVDNYLDTQLFDIYMENVEPSVTVRVLTHQVGNPLQAVAEKFSKRGSFELRSSKDVHDRVIFGDERCWVIGQSIKDAAKKKPTYIVEHAGAATMNAIYEALWSGSQLVVKG